MNSNPQDMPLEVHAEDGVVFIEGPAGTAVSMTPRAAQAMSRQLLEKSFEAHGQELLRRPKSTE